MAVTYDAFGRNVGMNYPSEMFWAPDNSWSVLFKTGVARRAIFKLPGGSVAAYDEGNGGLFYYGHADHLGSIGLQTTAARTLYVSTAVAPFGEPYAQTSVAPTSFTGQGSSFTIDLYDFPLREYSDQGRWASPDPAGLGAVDATDPQTWNRYAYVRNSPLTLTDSTGMDPCDFDPSCGGDSGGDFGGGDSGGPISGGPSWNELPPWVTGSTIPSWQNQIPNVLGTPNSPIINDPWGANGFTYRAGPQDEGDCSKVRWPYYYDCLKTVSMPTGYFIT